MKSEMMAYLYMDYQGFEIITVITIVSLWALLVLFYIIDSTDSGVSVAVVISSLFIVEEEVAINKWLSVQVSLLRKSNKVIRWTLEVDGTLKPWSPEYGEKKVWEMRLAYPVSETKIVLVVELRDGTIIRGPIIKVP